MIASKFSFLNKVNLAKHKHVPSKCLVTSILLRFICRLLNAKIIYLNCQTDECRHWNSLFNNKVKYSRIILHKDNNNNQDSRQFVLCRHYGFSFYMQFMLFLSGFRIMVLIDKLFFFEIHNFSNLCLIFISFVFLI